MVWRQGMRLGWQKLHSTYFDLFFFFFFAAIIFFFVPFFFTPLFPLTLFFSYLNVNGWHCFRVPKKR